MISDEDITALGKLIGPDMLDKWDGLSRKLSSGSKITVANTGIYSSGKSSLFNALLGRVSSNDIRFPVGAIPVTSAGDREPLTDNIDLLDTPGIDSTRAADDAVALSMLMQSDLIIMTHNVKRGMMDRKECEWLRRITEGIPRKSLSDRLIFAAAFIDEIHDESDMQKLRSELHRQIAGIAGDAVIQFVEVSAKMYKVGLEKSKRALQDASGIPAFKNLLITTGRSYAKKSASQRKQELLALCRDSRDRLNTKRSEILSDIDKKKRAVFDRYSAAFEKWHGILGRFASMKLCVLERMREIYDAYDSASEYQIFRDKIYSI